MVALYTSKYLETQKGTQFDILTESEFRKVTVKFPALYGKSPWGQEP